MNEVFLPILEMRTSTLRQKSILLAMLYRLSQDPQALVEIYLNYDCDREAAENIYERLMNIISKMGTGVNARAVEAKEAASKETADNVNSKAVKAQLGPVFPPSPNTTVLGGKNAQDSAAYSMPGFTEAKLKKQSLEALVAVLRSLVVWGTGAGSGGLGVGPAALAGSSSRTSMVPGEESGGGSARMSQDGVEEPPVSAQDASRAARSSTSTPDLVDDPGRFETAKQKKTTLLEGIRKFNFKPKRVCS